MPDTSPPAAKAPTTPGTLPAATTAAEGSTWVMKPRTATERYELRREIARGGMGVVYRATDAAFGREVAVKVLHERFESTSGAARRFADEAQITGQLQHPAIPPVHDLGTLPDGRPFLAMKLVEGDTLDARLAARPDPSADRGQFVAVFEQVCQAVAFAHAHGVIHRDLKPANIMVGSFGEVQVMDWGLAKVLSGDAASAEHGDDPDTLVGGARVATARDSDHPFTQIGSVLGTPAFMPPEQATGAVDLVDARSDVFGLGGILAAILTGRPPFLGDTAESTWDLAARGKVQDCFTRLDASGADPELMALCKRCLAPAQTDRPADAGEVAKAVAALRIAADERARQAELDRAAAELRAAEQRRRRTLLAGAGAAVVVILTAAAAVSAWQARLARNAETTARDAEARAVADADTARKAEATARTAESNALAARDAEKRERESADDVIAFVSSVFTFASSTGQGKLPVREPTIKQALDNAEAKIRDRFADRPLVEAKVRKAIAVAYHGLNDFRGALPHLRRRLEIHRAHLGDENQTTWEDMNNLGQVLVLLGRKHDAEAEELLATVLMRKRAKLGNDDISTVKGINNLAGLYRRQARADMLALTPFPTPGNVARLARIGQKLTAAGQLQLEAYETCRRVFPPDHDQTLKSANNLGTLLIDQGRPGDAVAYYREAADGYQRSLGDRFPTAQCRSNVGDALLTDRKFAEAEGEYRRALEILDRIPAREGARLRAQIESRLVNIRTVLGTTPPIPSVTDP